MSVVRTSQSHLYRTEVRGPVNALRRRSAIRMFLKSAVLWLKIFVILKSNMCHSSRLGGLKDYNGILSLFCQNIFFLSVPRLAQNCINNPSKLHQAQNCIHCQRIEIESKKFIVHSNR